MLIAVPTGKITLNDAQKSKLRIALESTDYISIREKESIPALQELTEKRIQHTLDPTLLLDRSQWDAICVGRLIDEDYMFCYFLGNNEHLRTIARQYAEKRNLKLVALPYLNGAYRAVDDGFGDYQLFDIAPGDFLSLIKHASFVMTDSFHGSVFCHIFGTEFAVSGGGKDEMGCRMISLTELFGTENRYIREHDDVTVDALIAMENEPMVLDTAKFEYMRQKSLAFLKEALEND